MNRQTFCRGIGSAGLSFLCAITSLAQSGSVNFANDVSCKVINGQTASPAASGTAALYWAPTNSSSFVQIGASTPLGNPVAGYFAGGTHFTPVAGGVPGRFQVRAWMGAYTTYEQAIAVPGTLASSSVIVTLTTGNPAGDPPTPPASLVAAGLLSFTLNPSVNPPLTLTCASNKTVACSGWDFDAPTTNGGCGTITVTVISNSFAGVCPQLFTRTWQATDGCTTQTCSQTVTVIDTIPPIISCASNKSVACTLPWTFDPPTVGDACSSPTLEIVGTVTNALCGNTFLATRTWRAMDACGNTNSCSQTVTVVDTTPPELVCATNKFALCGAEWEFDEPAAYDACSGTNLTMVIVSTVTNHPCPLVVTRTWAAVDGCGNSNTCSQTVTATPRFSPKLPASKPSVVYCTNEWSFPTPELADMCGTNIEVEVVGTVTNSLCPLSLTRTWRVVHECQPEGLEWSQTIIVLCPDCPLLQLTKACPAYPVPPAGTLAWTGTITNASDVTISNIMVVSDQPATNTVVLGPVTLAAGEGTSFAGTYPVPASSGPHTGTLLATGVGPDEMVFTGSATASCAGTNHITPGDVNGDGIVSQAELNTVLANYWPHSEWIYMTNAALLCDGRFQFALTNTGAWNFTVQVSTNATDWTSLPTPAFPVYQFVDPEGTNAPQRLYRLKWP